MVLQLRNVIRLPYDTIRFAYRQLRKALFTAPRPTGRYLVADAPVSAVEAALGGQSYAPNWEFSYHERGEILNLARVVYEEHAIEGTRYRWWQTHVRGWDHPEGVALHGHWELEPTENDRDHVDGVGFDFARGMDNLQAALDDADVSYTETTIE
jgi:hypothetical protein